MTRPLKTLLTLGIIAGLTGAVWGVTMLAQAYFSHQSQNSPEARCSEQVKTATHIVRIVNGAASPATVEARRCDTLTIINTDSAVRRLAFGVHSHHVAYGATEGKMVGQDGSLSVTLVTTGAFVFHDHFDERVHGTFIVKE